MYTIDWDVPLNILQLLKGLKKSYGEAGKQPLYCDSFSLYIARGPVESGTQSAIWQKREYIWCFNKKVHHN